MTVVIFAQECDASVDEVIGKLTDREVSVFRADTSWLPQRLTIQARLEGEARVVVVGDRVFPFLIHADSAAARIDWRTDYRALRYELAELPVSVENGVRCYMAAFGLVYA
ncbi:MAG: hypothetical protein M3Y48_00795, partial [Actinomycetota bacterium]|nr:hypothetical protein [Actinomycetota bacterium]